MRFGLIFVFLYVCPYLPAQTPVTVTLASSPNPSEFGRPVTLTATVAPIATGKVTFYDGTSVLGVGTLSGTEASLSTALLPAGTRALHAHYSGDSTHAANNSTPVIQTVGPPVNTMALGAAVHYPVGFAPLSLAQGDFNGDGKPDLVVANYALSSNSPGTTVSVLLGKGDGTFQAAVNYIADGFPVSVAVGDFNGDGFADLVTADSHGASVLFGNGDGTFQAAVDYSAGHLPSSVAVADFDNDGRADLVVTNALSNDVSILLGRGDGTFLPAVAYGVGAAPQFAAVGDYNGDGIADLAVANVNNSNVSILLGLGDGTFQPAVNYAAQYHPISMATGDFNGDGKTDLVVAGDNFSVFIGNGDGTFQAAVIDGNGLFATSVAVADFNGDGKEDLAFAGGAYPGYVRLFPGHGDGTFEATEPYLAGQSTRSMIVGDFNGDGKVDVATVDDVGNDVTVLLGFTSSLSITSTHSGDFIAGAYGDYTLTVSNRTSADPQQGTVTVTETLTTGIDTVSMTGPGWSCSSFSCTRSDVLNPGSSYPPITATVRVSTYPWVGSQVTNQVSVCGRGSPTAFASDVTNVTTEIAAVVNPVPGSVLIGSSFRFSWASGIGADQFRLDVGSAEGLADYFSAVTAQGFLYVDTLPCNATAVYVQLWTHRDGIWQPPQQFTYTAIPSCTNPNLVSLWKLDEGSGVTSFADASGNGNTGGCAGSACPSVSVPGHLATAAAFNGVNSQIVIPDSVSLRLNRFTISLWVYPTQVKTDYQPLVVKEDSSGSNRNYGLFIAPNSMQIRYAVWAGDCVTKFAANSNGQLALNRWNHVAFTYDGVTEKLYLNGGLDSSNAASAASLCQAAVPVKLGMETSTFAPLHGTLDEVAIYGQALSAGGVQSLYNSLAAYWKLDESSAGSFADASYNGNSGVCGSSCTNMRAPGVAGTAAGFNGQDSQIVIRDSDSLRLNQFTIGLWVYPMQQKADYQPLVVKEDSAGNNRNYGLFLVPNSLQVRYAVWAGDCATKFAANSAGQLQLYAWNHITFSYDGITEKLYLNGLLDSSNAAPAASLCQAAVPVKLGMETSAFLPFGGLLDDIQIYSQALSASGVLRIYHAPAAYWRLDEGFGATSIADASGHGNNGVCGSACPSSGVSGKLGTAAGFNGVHSQITVPSSSSLRLDYFTMALWVYPTQVKNNYQLLIAKEDATGNNRNYGLLLAPNSMQIRYSVWAFDCATKFAATSVGQLTLNAWNHVAFTYDGSVEKLYLNGVLDSSNAATGFLCKTSAPVQIGSETAAFLPFSGTLDDIHIHSYALSAAGVASLYTGP